MCVCVVRVGCECGDVRIVLVDGERGRGERERDGARVGWDEWEVFCDVCCGCV